ncbi:hypothetical protein BOTBODRAFT_58809 [Botryobasidium botryosum FD-172 SS1]|uniref:Amino-acid acetyltransferase, mitochondrial n=1 Tax=Botryobasidium botryosum (strain FD-172 SS1) TaxID=930990 RepID=A0A067MB98_BOTB1|nr:hypothetical protein BOTBODRAFT_58809 [Botryobasidium botryosum FD-172 SS1]
MATCRLYCQFTVRRGVGIASKRSFTSHSSVASLASRRLKIDPPVEPETTSENDFILSVLRAGPSLRDTKSYLASILNPIKRRAALVKLHGPFTDRQLESVAQGLEYLDKLGLVSVIVVERDDWERGSASERADVIGEIMRVAKALEDQGARARPIPGPIVRLGPNPALEEDRELETIEAHVLPKDLTELRSALRSGEMPVLPPFALDSFSRSLRVDSNDVIAALVRGMMEAAALDMSPSMLSENFDLTPLRLMIINREGGIPSYARSGLPHLLINLGAEVDHIHETFLPKWKLTHPTALSNLRLARTCLSYMPRTSSAVIVSHRSPKSLIANLITNKPAHSSSLPHALLSGPKSITPHTPTLIRHGLPIRVIRQAGEIDQEKMTALLEQSFGRKLESKPFYDRLQKDLDFAIVAGDYAGAAIVTSERGSNPHDPPLTYLDKFAVLPSHQGDGTVDFLWVALHDESYGLGLTSALNPNVGGKQGRGTGRDLVWRSRANNPVNKWYYERSSGHLRLGDWVMFWCDAEERLARREAEKKEQLDGREVWRGKKRGIEGLSFVEDEERARLDRWGKIVTAIKSSWLPRKTVL